MSSASRMRPAAAPAAGTEAALPGPGGRPADCDAVFPGASGPDS